MRNIWGPRIAAIFLATESRNCSGREIASLGALTIPPEMLCNRCPLQLGGEFSRSSRFVSAPEVNHYRRRFTASSVLACPKTHQLLAYELGGIFHLQFRARVISSCASTRESGAGADGNGKAGTSWSRTSTQRHVHMIVIVIAIYVKGRMLFCKRDSLSLRYL